MWTNRSRTAEKLGWVWKCFLSFAWLRSIESHCLLRFPECDGRHRCCWDVTSVGGFRRCRHTSGCCVPLSCLCVIHLKTGRWDHSKGSCWSCDEWQRCRRTLLKCQRSNTEFHHTMTCSSLSPSVTLLCSFKTELKGISLSMRWSWRVECRNDVRYCFLIWINIVEILLWLFFSIQKALISLLCLGLWFTWQDLNGKRLVFWCCLHYAHFVQFRFQPSWSNKLIKLVFTSFSEKLFIETLTCSIFFNIGGDCYLGQFQSFHTYILFIH